MTAAPKISLKNVSKSFGDKHVLNNLSLDVGEGESLVVIGGSGTGKSVMLKCILGLLEPESGEIFIDGQQVLGLPRAEREKTLLKTGMLFQYAALFDSLPVWENVAFGLIQGKGMKRKDAREIAMEKLRRVGLGPDVGELSPAELSGGMQQRLQIARNLVTEPRLVFMDEPTGGLDVSVQARLLDLLRGLVRQMGLSALIVTHDLAVVRLLADRLMVMKDGHVVESGLTDQVLDDPQHAYTQLLVSSVLQV